MKKILVRKGVFETNSSSCHSISIADDTKQFVMDTIYPNEDGVITVHGDEFGWEWFKHNDAVTKVSYAAQQFSNNPTSLETLAEVIKEQTGADDVKFILDGHVDHDSYGIVPSDRESLKNFIFNKNSWLFGGNDNSTADPMFYDVPEYRDGEIAKTKYTHELVVEGYWKTTKFKSKPIQEDIEEGLHALLDGVFITENGTFDDDNSIFAQLHRDRTILFEFSGWRNMIDFENQTVIFIKEAWSTAKKIYDQDPENKNLDWGKEGYDKCRKIERSLIDDETKGHTKKISFHIKEI